MYAAAGPSPAPVAPWHPAHHLSYVALPACADCPPRCVAVSRDNAVMSGTITTARRGVPRPSMPRMESLMGSSLGAARFPRARSPTRLLVEEDDHRPDLV